MTTQIVYSDEFLKHDNSNHPEKAERLVAIMNEIKKTSFFEDLNVIEPKILPEKLLYNVHSDSLIQLIKKASSDEGEWIDLDTYVCPSSFNVARLAAGGVLQACENVVAGRVDNAYALVRPPGHHATRNNSMGFCLFNNIAIAANEISMQNKKILIFDFDVHHGNGTQDIFYDRKDVLYQSIHLSPHYPGTGSINEMGIGEGEGYTVNAPLSHGNGNKAVSKILEKVFLPIAKQFKPDLILVSCGYDSHHADPLGGLRFNTNFYAEMIVKYQKIQPKIVCTLEGGYNLKWMGKCVASQLGQMANQPIRFNDSVKEEGNVDLLIENIKDELGRYWNF